MKAVVPVNTEAITKNEGSVESAGMDYVAVKNAAKILRAINQNLRQRILKLLEENKRMNVSDIFVKLRMEQSITSQHLAILRRAGTVTTERKGKEIYYSLNTARIAAIALFIEQLVLDPNADN